MARLVPEHNINQAHLLELSRRLLVVLLDLGLASNLAMKTLNMISCSISHLKQLYTPIRVWSPP